MELRNIYNMFCFVIKTAKNGISIGLGFSIAMIAMQFSKYIEAHLIMADVHSEGYKPDVAKLLEMFRVIADGDTAEKVIYLGDSTDGYQEFFRVANRAFEKEIKEAEDEILGVTDEY